MRMGLGNAVKQGAEYGSLSPFTFRWNSANKGTVPGIIRASSREAIVQFDVGSPDGRPDPLQYDKLASI
jgi:hypothetical protein